LNLRQELAKPAGQFLRYEMVATGRAHIHQKRWQASLVGAEEVAVRGERLQGRTQDEEAS
jgi:hypothetical protein